MDECVRVHGTREDGVEFHRGWEIAWFAGLAVGEVVCGFGYCVSFRIQLLVESCYLDSIHESCEMLIC